MPVRIQCPSCSASLNMPESMYGKAVRCPSCQKAFQCPPGPTAASPLPPPPTARRAPAPARPAARGAGGGSPFDFEGPAEAPPPVPEYGYQPRGTGVPRRRRTGWDRVRGGFLFLYLSAGCFLLAYVFNFLPTIDRKSPPSVDTLKLYLTLIWVFLVAGTALGAVGLMYGMAAPAESRTRGVVSVAAVFMMLSALAVTVAAVIFLIALYSKKPPADEGKLLLIATTVFIATLIGSFLLTIFFLVLAGAHLQRWGLVGSVVTYTVVVVVGNLVLLFLPIIRLQFRGPRPLGPPEEDALEKYAPLGLVVVAVLWFVLLLVGLSGGISRARARTRY